MSEQEVELIKRVQFLEYKLEVVYKGLKQLQDINLDEYKEA
jgi:hypothetical protein